MSELSLSLFLVLSLFLCISLSLLPLLRPHPRLCFRLFLLLPPLLLARTREWSLLLLLLLLWHLVGARVVGLLATESCLLGSRVLPPITGAA